MKRGARRGRVSLRARGAARGPSRSARPRPAPGGGGTLSRTSGGTLHARQQSMLTSVLLPRAAWGLGPRLRQRQ